MEYAHAADAAFDSVSIARCRELLGDEADGSAKGRGWGHGAEMRVRNRTEILEFVRKREYALTPLGLANAMAGLQYITARRSAQRCSHIKCKLARSTAFELFVFVSSVWKRHRAKRKSSLIGAFEKAIRKLPKFEIVEGHKRFKWFRGHLAENWYYLKRALQEQELAKLLPGAVPGAIVRQFLKNMHNPASPITPKLAEAERIQD